jgi:hypothetical protein
MSFAKCCPLVRYGPRRVLVLNSMPIDKLQLLSVVNFTLGLQTLQKKKKKTIPNFKLKTPLKTCYQTFLVRQVGIALNLRKWIIELV